MPNKINVRDLVEAEKTLNRVSRYMRLHCVYTEIPSVNTQLNKFQDRAEANHQNFLNAPLENFINQKRRTDW